MRNLIDRIKSALEAGEPEREPDEEELRLAAAVLMVELSRADFEISEPERVAVKRAIRNSFGLDEQEASDLLDAAEREADSAVSMHRYVDSINRMWSPYQKGRLIETLWRIAFSDAEMHALEEHLVRRLAGLLHVPHKEFLKAKLKVESELGKGEEEGVRSKE